MNPAHDIKGASTSLQIRRLCEPDFLVVVFDHPTGRLSRLAICEDYKRHRKQMPSQLVLQLHKAKALCSAMGKLAFSLAVNR